MDRGATNQIVRTWSLGGDDYLLFYLGKSYLTTCSKMLTPTICLQTVERTQPWKWCQSFSPMKVHTYTQNTVQFQKTWILTCLALVFVMLSEMGFFLSLTVDLENNSSNSWQSMDGSSIFSQISEALESLKLSKNPRERRQAGLQGQEDTGTRGARRGWREVGDGGDPSPSPFL